MNDKVNIILEGLLKKDIKDYSPESWKSILDTYENNLKASKENLNTLRSELKKHLNDEHTDYIKKCIKRAEDRVKSLESDIKELNKELCI